MAHRKKILGREIIYEFRYEIRDVEINKIDLNLKAWFKQALG